MKNRTITEWLLMVIAIFLALITWKLYSIPTTADFIKTQQDGTPEKLQQLRRNTPHITGEVTIVNDVTVNGEVEIKQ